MWSCAPLPRCSVLLAIANVPGTATAVACMLVSVSPRPPDDPRIHQPTHFIRPPHHLPSQPATQPPSHPATQPPPPPAPPPPTHPFAHLSVASVKSECGWVGSANKGVEGSLCLHKLHDGHDLEGGEEGEGVEAVARQVTVSLLVGWNTACSRRHRCMQSQEITQSPRYKDAQSNGGTPGRILDRALP